MAPDRRHFLAGNVILNPVDIVNMKECSLRYVSRRLLPEGTFHETVGSRNRPRVWLMLS